MVGPITSDQLSSLPYLPRGVDIQDLTQGKDPPVSPCTVPSGWKARSSPSMHETQAPLGRPRTAELGSSLQSSAEIVRPWGAGPDLDESPQTSSRGSGQLPASHIEALLGHPSPLQQLPTLSSMAFLSQMIRRAFNFRQLHFAALLKLQGSRITKPAYLLEGEGKGRTDSN